MGMIHNEGTLPMAAAGGHTAKREAREFLLERLEAGPVKSDDLIEAGKTGSLFGNLPPIHMWVEQFQWVSGLLYFGNNLQDWSAWCCIYANVAFLQQPLAP
jgi:hypothetical protein